MVDVFSKEKRSWIMSRIRSKNSKLEVSFRKILWREGFRYRVHYKKLPGKPDIVFTKQKVAVFIDSHFWHGYDWEKKKKKLKSEYWQWKIPYNMERDKRVNKELKKMGWKVLRFWEHEIKKNPYACIDKIRKALL
ncbi:very short patch repair endonuclease [Candidatus Woesearchaeota archaeon]|nr:MAG: very short patch repair endonuclease [Candidatus Woesearchaeota archaeon]